MSFLREMALDDIVQKNTLVEWAYERRRQAQMILPWLFLGPMVAAKDRDFIAREGITMVLAIRFRDGSMSGALQAARDAGLAVATIEAQTYHELIKRFSEITRIVNEHVAGVRQHTLQQTGQPTLGKVLVFCESGNEKSAAVVAAYLMDILDDFDYIKAMQVCQAQRFCVNFDDAMKRLLQGYWDILCARRSVAADRRQSVQNGVARSKRALERDDDDNDESMDGMQEDDLERFGGRTFRPFVDAPL